MTNGKFLSEQLSFLPEEMLEEAIEENKRAKQRHATIRALKLVACFCIIIGLLFSSYKHKSSLERPAGILIVTAYAMDSDGEHTQLEEGVSLPYSYTWNPAISIVPGLPLRLSVKDGTYSTEKITFRISSEHGSFLKYEGCSNDTGTFTGNFSQLPTEFDLANGSTIFWRCWYKENGKYSYFEGDIAYVDIIIYEGNRIIGYAVLKISRLYSDDYGRTWNFSATLVESVAFESEITDISEPFVRKQIEAAKEQG